MVVFDVFRQNFRFESGFLQNWGLLPKSLNLPKAQQSYLFGNRNLNFRGGCRLAYPTQRSPLPKMNFVWREAHEICQSLKKEGGGVLKNEVRWGVTGAGEGGEWGLGRGKET